MLLHTPLGFLTEVGFDKKKVIFGKLQTFDKTYIFGKLLPSEIPKFPNG